jgi:hypothetical protein
MRVHLRLPPLLLFPAWALTLLAEEVVEEGTGTFALALRLKGPQMQPPANSPRVGCDMFPFLHNLAYAMPARHLLENRRLDKGHSWQLRLLGPISLPVSASNPPCVCRRSYVAKDSTPSWILRATAPQLRCPSLISTGTNGVPPLFAPSLMALHRILVIQALRW